jgi:hypothetical protein
VRKRLASLAVLALVSTLVAAPAPAAAIQDDLGLPVFTGGDPVPDEPVGYHPRKMMQEIYAQEKGGDSVATYNDGSSASTR